VYSCSNSHLINTAVPRRGPADSFQRRQTPVRKKRRETRDEKTRDETRDRAGQERGGLLEYWTTGIPGLFSAISEWAVNKLSSDNAYESEAGGATRPLSLEASRPSAILYYRPRAPQWLPRARWQRRTRPPEPASQAVLSVLMFSHLHRCLCICMCIRMCMRN
jgi:hypothetical protein